MVADITAYHIAITGGFGTGKTAFLKSLCKYVEFPTIDMYPGLPPTQIEDEGELVIDETATLAFHICPGSHRLLYLWEPPEPLGWVIMVDSVRPAIFREERSIIETARHYFPMPFVIAANFQDHPDAWTIEELRIALKIPLELPIVPCVATNRESTKGVLLALLERVLETCEA